VRHRSFTSTRDGLPVSLDRRTFLKAGATAAVAVPLLPARALADLEPDPALAPFLHGVASGDPLADRVVLWTRVTGGTGDVPVRWVVGPRPRADARRGHGTTTAPLSRDSTVKVDPAGLAPSTTYFYAFEALGRRSMVGRTRTAPAGDVDRLRFAVASCAKYDQGFFNAYARMAEADVDAVLHCGGSTYTRSRTRTTPRRAFIDPRTETYTLRSTARHAQYSSTDLQRVHQQHPFVPPGTTTSRRTTLVRRRQPARPERDGRSRAQGGRAAGLRTSGCPIGCPAGRPTIIYRALRTAPAELVVSTPTGGRSEQLPGRYNDGELFSGDPRAADPSGRCTAPRSARSSSRRSPARTRRGSSSSTRCSCRS
jgi:hypothetical protein